MRWLFCQRRRRRSGEGAKTGCDAASALSSSQDGSTSEKSQMATPDLNGVVTRLEDIASRLEKIAPLSGNSPSSATMEPTGPLSPFVAEFDSILSGILASFQSLSSRIGAEVAQQVEMVRKAFQAQRYFLATASRSKQPDQSTLVSLLKPTSDTIQAIQEFREKNRASAFFNHLSAISESIPALGWVAVAPAPAPFVKEMLDAGQFYSNRVLRDYKDKDKLHVDWAKAWIEVLTELQAYVKKHHTTGLTWYAQGGGAVPTFGGAAPPPPPPPPPPPADLFLEKGPPSLDDSRAALFKDISKGEDITKGLRKVAPDQQTHKNPSLRAESTVPSSGGARPTAVSPAKPPPQRPPRLELDGKKWKVEYQVDRQDLVIGETEMSQSVNVYQCQNCVIMVKGKINSITVDSCKKTSIVFEDIVSTVEFINCRSIQAQSMGTLPTLSVDKSESVIVYLSQRSLDCEIVSAMSTALNVAVPKGDGDFVEHSIPEQFKSVWTGKNLKTVPIEKN